MLNGLDTFDFFLTNGKKHTIIIIRLCAVAVGKRSRGRTCKGRGPGSNEGTQSGNRED